MCLVILFPISQFLYLISQKGCCFLWDPGNLKGVGARLPSTWYCYNFCQNPEKYFRQSGPDYYCWINEPSHNVPSYLYTFVYYDWIRQLDKSVKMNPNLGSYSFNYKMCWTSVCGISLAPFCRWGVSFLLFLTLSLSCWQVNALVCWSFLL